MDAKQNENLVTVGKVSTAYGVKGWVNVFSYTDPPENLLNYREWMLLHRDGHKQSLRVVDGKRHRNAFVVRLDGVDNREQASALTNALVRVPVQDLPALEADEFYWHQLEGMAVMLRAEQGVVREVGVVSHLFETGANDVMVVELCTDESTGSAGGQWLVPFLPDQVVKSIDLENRQIEVDWWLDGD